ncbi:MAG: AAA family ATPase [Saprospiraceae bacterium]|nr:AAA family ATPase [Saprospiraceae bacterium]
MIEDQKGLILNDDFRAVLDILENSRESLFITGRAGTGKSTLLQLFRNTTRKKIVVLAPTGVAALNVKGQTIHSFFGFPPRPLSREDIKKRRFRKLYENLEVLVIDEISMVRADLLDNIDWFLRVNRDDDRPFGGVQLALFGDLFQLPPVVASAVEKQLFSTYYDSPYFFSSDVIKHDMDLQILELQHVYRQEERRFLRLLEAVRLNRADIDELEELNVRHLPQFQAEDSYITLSARNNTVDAINQRELARITDPGQWYQATIGGQFNPMLYPTEAQLLLKTGAQVMFLKNDPEKQYVNGTIGKITKLDYEEIEVTVREGGEERKITVVPVEWEVVKYKTAEDDPKKIETEVVGTFKQFPLKAAWAITIHKAQGKTFDRVIIDMGNGAFEHGQTYVALSRCRTLQGIILKQALRRRDILTDERIVEFYEQFRRFG